MEVKFGIHLIKFVTQNHRFQNCRPRSDENEFCFAYDIISSSKEPPVGAILLKISECKPAMHLKKVFTSTKLNLSVWRPIPPDGYSSLGDIASVGNQCPEVCVLCPLAAVVRDASIGKKVLSSPRGGSGLKPFPISIWEVNGCCIGAFLGSPSLHRSADVPPVGCEISGVGRPLNLYFSCSDSIISGDWTNEFEVLHRSSISWTKYMVERLLSNDSTKDLLLKSSVFTHLVKFFLSKSSPKVLLIVPTLISLLRSSRNAKITMPLHLLDQACRDIFKRAYGMKVELVKGNISDGILLLTDLIIEVKRTELVQLKVKYILHSKLSSLLIIND